MQNRNGVDRGVVTGFLLVLAGLFFLLQTLEIIHLSWRVAVGLGMLLGAAIFLMVFLQDRRQWWALFPALGLGTTAVQVGFEGVLPSFQLGGSIFLLAIGAAFALVYRSDRHNWWAIIPAGVLFTLGAVSSLEQLLPRIEYGWLFFGGLAATFGYLWWETNKVQSWALIPALACAALAVLILVGSLLKFLVPLLLVGAGVLLLARQKRPPGSSF